MSRKSPKYHPLLKKIKSLAGFIRMVERLENPTPQQIMLLNHHRALLADLKPRWRELRHHMDKKADNKRVMALLSEDGKEAFNIGRLNYLLRKMKKEMIGDYTEAEREYLETRRAEKIELYGWAVEELTKKLNSEKLKMLESKIGIENATGFYRKVRCRKTIWQKEASKAELWILRLETEMPTMSPHEKEVAMGDIEFLKSKLAEFAEIKRQKTLKNIIKRKNKARRKRDRMRARERGIKPRNSAIDEREYICARVAIRQSGCASLIFELSKIRKNDRLKNWQKRVMLKNLIKRANAGSYV